MLGMKGSHKDVCERPYPDGVLMVGSRDICFEHKRSWSSPLFPQDPRYTQGQPMADGLKIENNQCLFIYLFFENPTAHPRVKGCDIETRNHHDDSSYQQISSQWKNLIPSG
jgi:hypothetical protein